METHDCGPIGIHHRQASLARRVYVRGGGRAGFYARHDRGQRTGAGAISRARLDLDRSLWCGWRHDITARLLAKDLEGALGKPVTVENRAGGGGWVGWGALAQAKPDGYTLGYLNVPSMYAGYLDRQYNRKETLDSFTPLINHVLDYNV